MTPESVAFDFRVKLLQILQNFLFVLVVDDDQLNFLFNTHF